MKRLRLLARTPLVRLLWAAPAVELTDAKRQAFERSDVDAHPKHEYLRWLVATAGPPVLLHGSAADIDMFEPREQTDWDGRPTRAVFATSDGIWPIFFAIADRRAVASLGNGFPFLDRVGRHDRAESVARTLWKAVRSRP